MPKLPDYKNKKQLRVALEGLGRSFNRGEYLRYNLVVYSVGNNTIRAFKINKHNNQHPSVTFQEWANDSFIKNYPTLIKTLLNINSQQEYDKWHNKLCNSFDRYWYKKMGYRIGYGPSRKLPDLLLKVFVLGSEDIPDANRSVLIKLLHVPLDSYSLTAIMNCVDDYLKDDNSVLTIKEKRFMAAKQNRINKYSTMKWVDNKDKYMILQKIIRDIAENAKAPAIYLDLLAWDESHK
jgi:hypothetical protein